MINPVPVVANIEELFRRIRGVEDRCQQLESVLGVQDPKTNRGIYNCGEDNTVNNPSDVRRI